MKRFLILFFTVLFLFPLQSCRETVAPDVLEEENEGTEEDSVKEVDLGDYDDN